MTAEFLLPFYSAGPAAFWLDGGEVQATRCQWRACLSSALSQQQ